MRKKDSCPGKIYIYSDVSYSFLGRMIKPKSISDKYIYRLMIDGDHM